MRNLAMVVSYEGTAYSGFQTQPFGNTVQDKLEEAVRHLTGEQVKIHGSGRTDAGVHARAQVIHFQTGSRIPTDRWTLAMNARLPSDIVVHAAVEVPDDFHARRSAIRKTYRYSIQQTRLPDVFHRRTRIHHPARLRTDEMRRALAVLEGEHDFTSFCSTKTPVGSHVRTIYRTSLELEPSRMAGDGDAGVIHIYVTGSGFLYNMVRIIVGTLLDIGQGKRTAADMAAVLEARDRKRAGQTAEPHGLILWGVGYGWEPLDFFSESGKVLD